MDDMRETDLIDDDEQTIPNSDILYSSSRLDKSPTLHRGDSLSKRKNINTYVINHFSFNENQPRK